MTGPAGAPPVGALSGWVRSTGAVVARPSLWSTAVAQVGRLAAPGWWRRPPFLPLPPAAYLRFRLQTAYGDRGRAPSAADVVSYLRWCRAWRSAVVRAHR